MSQPIRTQSNAAFYSDGTEPDSVIINSGGDIIVGNGGTEHKSFGTTILIRIVMGVTTKDETDGWRVEASKNSGAYDTFANIAGITAVDSANLTAGGDTTQRLGTGTFVTPNGAVGDNGDVASFTIPAGEECEFLWSLRIDQADVNDGDTFDIRIYNDSGVAIDNYTVTRRITVDKAEPQIGLNHFRVIVNDPSGIALNDTANFAAAEDTNPTNIVAEVPFEIVFGFQEEVGVASSAEAIKLQWKKGAGGTWADIGYTAWPVELSEVLTVSMTDCVTWTDGAATSTKRLAGLTGTYTNGTAEEGAATLTNLPALNASGCTEIVTRVIIRKLVSNAGSPIHNADGEDIYFRVVKNDGTEFPGTNNYPIVDITNDPGLIGGVFSETPKRLLFADGNKNIYTIVECSTLTSPRLSVMKSTDGGDSWNPVDLANVPSNPDFEAGDAYLESDQIHLIHQRDPVFRHIINVSTHGTPDVWNTTGQSIDGASNPTDQSCAVAKRNNGDIWVFYTDVSTVDKIYYRVFTGGSWGSKTDFEVEATNKFGGPTAIYDSVNDIIYVFYKDETNGITYYNTVSAGSLGTRQSVSTATTSTNTSQDHAQPTFWQSGTDEKIWCVYVKQSDRKLYAKLITNGSLGSEVGPIATHTIREDIAASKIANVMLVQDGTTTYCLYVDATTADMFVVSSDDGGTWGGQTEVLDGVTVDLFSATVFTHSAGNGGAKVIGISFANGSGGFTGDVRYGEYELISGISITPSPASVVVSARESGFAMVPPAASVIADTQDPTVIEAVYITPASASAVVSAPSPTVYTPLELTPASASVLVSTLVGGEAIASLSASVVVDTIPPTVSTPVTVTPASASAVVSTVDPTVSTGLSITPAPASVIVNTVDPAVIEAVYITPSPASTIVDTVDPTLTLGVSITPSPAGVVVSTIDPTVIESVYITPTPVSVIVDTQDPTVIEAVYITPQSASAVVSIVAPSVYAPFEWTAVASVVVSTENPTVIEAVYVTPTGATSVTSTVDPTVYTPFEYSPPTAFAVVSTIDPTVRESVYVYPASSSVVVSSVGPSVYTPLELVVSPSSVVVRTVDPQFGSEVSITPPPAGVVVSVVQPTVVTPVEVTPASASTIVSTIDPSVIEAAYITPVSSTVIASTIDPDVIEAAYVFPQPCVIVCDTVSPSVYTPLTITPNSSDVFVDTVSPTVYTPLELSAICSVVISTIDPTVIEASYITPAPSSVIVDTIDPSVYTPLTISGLFSEVVVGTAIGSISTPLSLTPTAVWTVVSTVDPEVQLGYLEITPFPASVVVSTTGYAAGEPTEHILYYKVNIYQGILFKNVKIDNPELEYSVNYYPTINNKLDN